MKTFKVVVQTSEDTTQEFEVEGAKYHIVNVADVAILEIDGTPDTRGDAVLKEVPVVFSTPVDKLVYIKEVADGGSSGERDTSDEA
jgi:hypothetical protein